MARKQYIGDGVFVDFDGYYIVLTTENESGPSNIIHLEQMTFDALVKYVDQIAHPDQQGER